MPSIDSTKKPVSLDWHRADIKAALEKRGWSVRRLSISHGFAPGSLGLALQVPWPKAEALISAAIGVPAQRIWPSRYHRDGTPRSKRGERGLGRYKSKNSTRRQSRNVYRKAA